MSGRKEREAMERKRWRRMLGRVLCGGAIAAAAMLPAGDAARADTVEFPALVSPYKVKIVVVGAPGGLAVDDSKNIYFSDQGSGLPGSGRLVMLRKGNDSALAIVGGLTKPADIELTKDQRGLIVAYDFGRVETHYFGLSVQIKDASGQIVRNATLTADTDVGATAPVKVSSDDYYHIPGLLVPEQTSRTVQLTIERKGKPAVMVEVTLGQPGEKKVYGETVKLLQLAD